MAEITLRHRSPVSLRDCNLSKSFEIIGDRWTLLILRSAFWGLRRFDDFHADIDVPRTVLSNRLAALVESGIMERREYREAGQRRRIEYPFTRMGRELGLPLLAVSAWGGGGLGGGVSHLTLGSKSTGQKFSVALVDERGRRANGSDVEMVIDPRFERKRRR